MPRQSTKIRQSCKNCGKEFWAVPSEIARGGRIYCSAKCFYSYQINRRVSLEIRFWNNVGRKTASGCVLWTGAIDAYGYGNIGSGGRNAKVLKAHRVAYELMIGQIPDNLRVLHHCDNPLCVNAPSHLFLGTQIDNIADMVAKGRHMTQKKNKRNWHGYITPSCDAAG